MTTTGEQKAAARRLVLAITRAGFAQLRKTSNGYLYGSGTFRMELPYAVVQGSATLAYMAELHQRFDVVRAQRDAEFGKPAPRPTDDVPVPNPDDLLLEEGGPPDGDTEAMNLAGAGSTPAPLATEATGRDAETANLAVVGSTPTSLPNIPPTEEDDTTMKRRAKMKGGADKQLKCDKCGREFGHAAWLGKHRKSCTGPKEVKAHKGTRAPRAKVTPEVARTNGHGGELALFEQASINLIKFVKGLEGEVQLYRRENEELRAFKQRASALFEAGPKVPRG